MRLLPALVSIAVCAGGALAARQPDDSESKEKYKKNLERFNSTPSTRTFSKPVVPSQPYRCPHRLADRKDRQEQPGQARLPLASRAPHTHHPRYGPPCMASF